jgi:CDP-glucose 4,6-dehydratase
VLDPLNGYLLLAERLWTEGARFAEGWNFGPRDDDAWPVESIVNRMVAHWGDDAAWHLSADSHPHEARYLKLDCAKARTRLGWKPRTDLETALRWSVDWHRGHLEGTDPRQLCRQQILEFLNADKELPCTPPIAAFAKAS